METDYGIFVLFLSAAISIAMIVLFVRMAINIKEIKESCKNSKDNDAFIDALLGDEDAMKKHLLNEFINSVSSIDAKSNEVISEYNKCITNARKKFNRHGIECEDLFKQVDTYSKYKLYI